MAATVQASAAAGANSTIMGKATIISDLGDGRYTIQPEWNATVAATRIASLTAENSEIDTRLGTIDTEISSAEFAYNYASDVLRAAIINEALEEEIEVKQRDALTKEAAWQGLKQAKSFLQLKKVANIKQIEFIEQMTATPAQVQAWCADYTEGASGVVGTIEIGRRATTPIIKPSGAAHAVADGEVVPMMSSSPAAAFVNFALAPGAAKWKPRYRTGVVGSIDMESGTMDVSLDPVRINRVDCDQETELTAIPVQYMTCNAAAFAPGDNVVVEFSAGWGSATVVGFVDNPKPCLGGFWLRVSINGHLCLRGGQQIVLRYNNTAGESVTTPARGIPAVGAPLAVDPLVSVPASNQSLAGPFALVDWDQSVIEVLLHRDRKDENTGVFFKNEKATAGFETVHDLRVLFDYYTDVGTDYANANFVINQDDRVLWGPRADTSDNPGCFDISQRRQVYGAGNGINTVITAPNEFGAWLENWGAGIQTRRGFRIGNYKRLNYYPVGELTSLMIAGGTTNNTVMDLSSGSQLTGQKVVEIACTAVFKAIFNDTPTAHPYGFSHGSYNGSSYLPIYDEDGAVVGTNSILDANRNPWDDLGAPIYGTKFNSAGCVEVTDPVTAIRTLQVPVGEVVRITSDTAAMAGKGLYFRVQVAEGSTVPTTATVSCGANQTLLHEATVLPVVRNGKTFFEIYSGCYGGLSVGASFSFSDEVFLADAGNRLWIMWAPLRAKFCSPRRADFTSFGYRSVHRNLGEFPTNGTFELKEVWKRSRYSWPNGRRVFGHEGFAPFYDLMGAPFTSPRVWLGLYGAKRIAIPHSSIDVPYEKSQMPIIIYDETTGAVTAPSISIVETEENPLVADGSGGDWMVGNLSETNNWTFNFTGIDIDVAGYL